MDPVFEALLSRGRIHLLAYLAHAWPLVRDRPIGASGLACITTADYVANPLACLRYAETTRSLHVLDPEGFIVAIIMPSERHRAPAGLGVVA